MDARNHVLVDAGECKGCGLCVEACPRNCLMLGTELNVLGYPYSRFSQRGCTACGMCFYACPEPGAITVIQDECGGEAAP
jgi:ferredoxin